MDANHSYREKKVPSRCSSSYGHKKSYCDRAELFFLIKIVSCKNLTCLLSSFNKHFTSFVRDKFVI